MPTTRSRLPANYRQLNWRPKDPDTTTRQVFTENILNADIPSDAYPGYADIVRDQKRLYKASYDHEAMAPNRQQTFMTPARQKSRVYFLWDFTGRTLQYLYMLDPRSQPSEHPGPLADVWADCLSRSMMSLMMVLDKSDKMTRMQAFNVDVDVPYGPDIEGIATEIKAQRDQVNHGHERGDPEGNMSSNRMLNRLAAASVPGEDDEDWEDEPPDMVDAHGNAV